MEIDFYLAQVIRIDEEVPRPVTCHIRWRTNSRPAIDVSQARELELLDMVAVLDSSGDPEVHSGDAGTVVELLPDGGLEVEFPNPNGRTRHAGTLSADDVLILNRERTRVA